MDLGQQLFLLVQELRGTLMFNGSEHLSPLVLFLHQRACIVLACRVTVNLRLLHDSHHTVEAGALTLMKAHLRVQPTAGSIEIVINSLSLRVNSAILEWTPFWRL